MNGSSVFGLIDLAAAGAAPTIAVGGKAQQLGRLLRFGLPVPDGFVLPAPALAAAFAGATRSADSRPPLPDAWRALLQAELARRGWQQTPLAVRSSAPQEDSASASFAGIHRSELNVIGEAALETAIAAVWASLWTAQAAAYRARHGIADGDAAMAVLVMPLLPAVVAGVAFTCEPQTGRDDRIVINAIHGLGEALVGGSENGEEIMLEEDRLSERLAVIARRPGRQNHAVVAKAGSGTTTQPVDAARLVLSDAQAVELGQLLRDAAQALDYADPAWDLEWVFDGGRFLLVQARPVTARRWHTYPGLAGQAAIWSNGNTRDVVPHVMGAMDWIGWRRMVDLMLEQGYRLAGYPLLPGARRSALLHGRLYLNAAFIQWEGYDALGVEPPAMNALLGGHHPEIAVPPPNWRDRLRRAGALLRYVVRSPAARHLGRQQAATAFAEAARWRSEDVARWDDATLIETLRERLIHIRTRNGMMFLQGSSGGNLYLLLDLVGRYLPAERHALVAAVMAGGEPSVTARQAYDLQALAQLAAGHPPTAAWLRRGRPWDLATLPAGSPFGPAFAAFLADYGHRGIYESYLRSPRFRDDPGYLLDNLAALLDCDPAAREARRQAAGEQAWQRLRAALPATRRWWARTLVGIARRESNDRELARSAFVAYSDVSRRLMLEAAGRLVRRGGLAQPADVFELTPHELFSALAGRLPGPALQARVAHRQRQLAAWDAEAAPEVLLGHQAAPLAPAPARRPGGGWHGVAVGSGCAEGTARVIHAPEQGVRLQAGDILVAPSTDPAWTPLFLRAGGLVMETGGYLSHGAIVAREFGIPAVVNLPGILDVLRDGQRLRVDGLRGQVLPLDGGESP